MMRQTSYIFKFSLGLYARGIFVFAQFYTLWTYSNSFSVEELSIYNIAITFALLSNTLIFHPFDTELQKRFTLRIRIKSNISVVQNWYSLLTLGLFIIFILMIWHTPITDQYLDMIILGLLLSLSSYLSHSIRTLYLNAGLTYTYNILVLTESLVKVGLLFIFTNFDNLSLFYFTSILVFSQSLTLVYFYFNERKKLNFRRAIILIYMFDARYIYRTTSNSFHWIITNFFRFSLIVSDRSGLLGMGLTFYSIGSAASQSVNMIVNQFLYPDFYHTKGEGLYKFCTIIAVSNLLLLTLTYLFLDYLSPFFRPILPAMKPIYMLF